MEIFDKSKNEWVEVKTKNETYSNEDKCFYGEIEYDGFVRKYKQKDLNSIIFIDGLYEKDFNLIINISTKGFTKNHIENKYDWLLDLIKHENYTINIE